MFDGKFFVFLDNFDTLNLYLSKNNSLFHFIVSHLNHTEYTALYFFYSLYVKIVYYMQ